MNDEDLRDSLAALAGRAPEPAPGAGARARRAVRHRFQATVATIGCLAVLVGVSGGIALTRDRSTSGLLVLDDPTASPTESSTPSVTPSPAAESPTPSPVVSVTPTPTPTPRPTPTPSPTPTTVDYTWPTTAPSAAPVPGAEPYDTTPVRATGQGEEGLRVSITLTPGGPRTAGAVTLAVHAVDDDGSVRVSSVDWGDGARQVFSYPMAACVPNPPTWTPQPDEVRETYRHSWREPGTFSVVVEVASSVQCVKNPPAAETAQATLDAEVQDGASVTNGPWLPYVTYADAQPAASDSQSGWLTVNLWDPDGWIHQVTVDWGDGSAPQVVHGDNGACDDGKGAHFPFMPGDFYFGESHTYPRAGTYHVTVTFRSTGCAGDDEQRGTVAGPMTVG